MKEHKDLMSYVGMAVMVSGIVIGASVPLGVFLLLKDAEQDVKMMLIGGVTFGGFAILYRLIESKVQIARDRAEAYRDAIAVAGNVYASGEQWAPAGMRFLGSRDEFEHALSGNGTNGRHSA